MEHVGQGFVELAEAGILDGPVAEETVRRSLRPLLDAGADRIVLVLRTHYPFLRNVIQRVAGPDVRIIDPAPAVARHLVDVMREEGLPLSEAATPAGPATGRAALQANLASSLSPQATTPPPNGSSTSFLRRTASATAGNNHHNRQQKATAKTHRKWNQTTESTSKTSPTAQTSTRRRLGKILLRNRAGRTTHRGLQHVLQKSTGEQQVGCGERHTKEAIECIIENLGARREPEFYEKVPPWRGICRNSASTSPPP